jgi:FMN-dependent NADH-azoreductase
MPHLLHIDSSGGAYGPGTPRQKYDFQEPYLRAFFEQLGVSDGLTFVHTELTKAYEEPHLARFRDSAGASYAAARAAARELAATTAPRAASRSN